MIFGLYCHFLCVLVSKLKKTRTKFLHYTEYLNSIKTIKQDLLLILVIVRQQNFLNCLPRVLQLLTHVIKYCEKVYERSGKNLFRTIKNSGKILDRLLNLSFQCDQFVYL